MGTLLQKIDRERQLSRVTDVTKAARQVLVTLSPESTNALDLDWCAGRGSKKTLIVLRPGETVTQPLDKMEAEFGPFARFKEYEECTDEAILDVLRDRISVEAARVLNRYDYVRGNGRGYHPDMNPIAPHRFPNLTFTILNHDGTREHPIHAHEVYGIGEWDPLKDQFVPKETEAEIKARFEKQLRDRDEELSAMRRELANLAGQFQSVQSTAAATAAAIEIRNHKKETAGKA